MLLAGVAAVDSDDYEEEEGYDHRLVLLTTATIRKGPAGRTKLGGRDCKH